MSAASSGMRGGQPSTTQPITAPWLSPKLVNRNRWPKVLKDMGVSAAAGFGSPAWCGGQIDRGAARRGRSPAASMRGHRRAKRLKQRAVYRIALRVVFGVPLHAQGKARRIGDPDRLDRVVLRHALDDDAPA